MQTTSEEVEGDIILGAHLVQAHYNHRFNQDGDVYLVQDEPLIAGNGELVNWSVTETMDDGWNRQIEKSIRTSARDETRATSRFEVISVTTVPLSDSGFGGGPRILVKRLDGDGELITYTRKCYFNSDVHVPVVLLRRKEWLFSPSS